MIFFYSFFIINSRLDTFGVFAGVSLVTFLNMIYIPHQNFYFSHNQTILIFSILSILIIYIVLFKGVMDYTTKLLMLTCIISFQLKTAIYQVIRINNHELKEKIALYWMLHFLNLGLSAIFAIFKLPEIICSQCRFDYIVIACLLL